MVGIAESVRLLLETEREALDREEVILGSELTNETRIWKISTRKNQNTNKQLRKSTKKEAKLKFFFENFR